MLTSHMAAQLGIDGEQENGVWTEKHDAEIQFQRHKRTQARLRSIQGGFARPREITPAAQAALRAAEDHEREVRRKYDVESRRPQARRRLPAMDVRLRLRGARVFVDDRHVESGAYLTKALTNLGMLRERNDKLNAQVFIVADISQPGQRISWISVLTGAMILTVETLCCLAAGQSGGAVVKYRGACTQPRIVWLSTRFAADHATLAGIVRGAAALPGMKWRLVNTETFNEKCTKVSLHDELRAFLSKSEVGSPGQAHIPAKCIVTHRNACDMLATLDRTALDGLTSTIG